MEIRPHHLLCIQKFTGHGYSAEFTAHMTSVVSKLAEDPNTQITVTQGCDRLCTRCPNNIEGACSTLEKVSIMDSAVLRICGLTYGQTVPWVDCSARARELIFKTDKFAAVCSSCQWFELCLNTKLRP